MPQERRAAPQVVAPGSTAKYDLVSFCVLVGASWLGLVLALLVVKYTLSASWGAVLALGTIAGTGAILALDDVKSSRRRGVA